MWLLLYYLKLLFMAMLRRLPGVSYVSNKVDNIKDRTNQKLQKAKHNAIRGGVVIISLGFVIWLSIFIYVVFYYAYIPPITHSRPIFLQFETCDDAKSTICSFPSAHIELTRRQQLLMVGQKYAVTVELEVPESDANIQQGMFLVCVELNAADKSIVAHGCRSTMLRYRSSLLKSITTAIFAPAYLFGSSEEKQTLFVDVFTDYVEDKARPVTDAYIEVRSRKLEVYSARLKISAYFSGLRHLMYHWPIVSAVVGVSLVLTMLLLIIGLSCHHISKGDGVAARATRQIRDHLIAFSQNSDNEDIEEEDAILNKEFTDDDDKITEKKEGIPSSSKEL